jgi:hypothetical protein
VSSAIEQSPAQYRPCADLLFSRFYRRETVRWGDVAGLVLVVAGVLLIVAES